MILRQVMVGVDLTLSDQVGQKLPRQALLFFKRSAKISPSASIFTGGAFEMKAKEDDYARKV